MSQRYAVRNPARRRDSGEDNITAEPLDPRPSAVRATWGGRRSLPHRDATTFWGTR